MSSDFPPEAPRRRPYTRRFVGAATSAASLLLPALGHPGPVAPPAGYAARTEVVHPAPMLLAYAAEYPAEDAVQKFFLQGYNYCDALVLADFWGESDAYQAKVRLGDRLLRGAFEEIDNAVRDARARASEKGQRDEWLCSWDEDGGYTYDDAEVLAKYWGIDSPWDAKMKIQSYMVEGYDQKVRRSLEDARANSQEAQAGQPTGAGYSPTNPAEDAVQKFFNYDFGYCDALVLAAFWGEPSAYDAKLRMGDKILNLGPDAVDMYVTPARSQASELPDDQLPCNYDHGDFSYEDAELLAGYWGAGDTYDAKIKIARMLIDGRAADVQSDIEAAREQQGGGPDQGGG